MDYYCLFFFFKDEVFFFNIILVIFYSVKSKAEKSFCHFTFTFFFNFIKFFFKVGCYFFEWEGTRFDFFLVYGTVIRFLVWFLVFYNFYKGNYLGLGFVGRYNAVYGRLFNGHGLIS